MTNRVSKTWTTKGLEITKDMKCTADNLADYIVHMTEKDMKKVDKALAISLSLK